MSLSKTRINRIRAQGYFSLSDQEIIAISWGNRMAYILCTLLLGIAIGTANIPMLAIMLCVAVGGFLLPYHPFDYLYNRVVAGLLGKPAIPRRSDQLKFACMLASIWLTTDIYLFWSNFNTAGYFLGAILFLVAFAVAFFDFCLPSVIYNALFLDTPGKIISESESNTNY